MNTTRLYLERLEDRWMPTVDTTWISTGSTDWSNALNWSNGVPNTNNGRAILDSTSTVNCSCSLTGQVAAGIVINSGYNNTLGSGYGRLHFTTSGSNTVTVGGSGIQMHDGGIEQDNGCTIQDNGIGAGNIDGGELNSESLVSAPYVVPMNGSRGFAGAGSFKTGDIVIVGVGATFTLNQTTTAGGVAGEVLFAKSNCGVLMHKNSTMSWQSGSISLGGSGSGWFNNQGGTVDYAARSANGSAEWCSMPYKQSAEDGVNPSFVTHAQTQGLTGNVSTLLDFPDQTATYCFEAIAGTVTLDSFGTTPAGRRDTVDFRVSATKMHITGGKLKVTGNFASAISGGDILADAGYIEITNGTFLLVSAHKLTLSGTVELDIHCDGTVRQSCGYIDAQDITIDATNAKLKAINDAAMVTAGLQWDFLKSTNNITVTNDFVAANETLLANDQAHHGLWEQNKLWSFTS